MAMQQEPKQPRQRTLKRAICELSVTANRPYILHVCGVIRSSSLGCRTILCRTKEQNVKQIYLCDLYQLCSVCNKFAEYLRVSMCLYTNCAYIESNIYFHLQAPWKADEIINENKENPIYNLYSIHCTAFECERVLTAFSSMHLYWFVEKTDRSATIVGKMNSQR